MNPGLDRRQWLRLVGAGATGTLLSCGDNDRGDAVEAVAVLEPTEDAFLVAVWSATARTAMVEVRTAGDVVGTTTLDLAPAAAVDVTSLAPDTDYEVMVYGAGTHGPFHVQTAPRADAVRPVRLAVSADCDPSPEFDSQMCAQIVAAEPELMITIGDFPYTDNGPPAQTVPEYRQRHVDLRNAPRVRPMHEALAVSAIYDDHEFRNDWDAHFVALEPARYAAAMQVWDEFFPLRTSGTIKYRSFRWGAGVECFMLDCRRFRSANAAPDDASKTMLGADQRAWFLASVMKSTATFKLIFTSVPLDYGLGDDHWASFTTERNAIFDALATAQVPGILFISGDQHWFAAHRHAYGIREFQIGPLARGLGVPPPPVPGVLFRSAQYNAGIIDIDGDELTFTGLGATGERFYTETLTPDALTPRKTSAR